MQKPEEIVIGPRQIVKLLAISPETKEGPLLCGASGEMVYFSTLKRVDDSGTTFRSKEPTHLIYKSKMPGTVTAAVFHNTKFEVYLKIENKVHTEGKCIVKQEIVALDLETKNCSAAESNLIPEEPWIFPAAPSQVVASCS